jgi:hypothetical protein
MASSWPKPEPGLVIRYSYLWSSEHLAGREEGVKDRPCAIVLAVPGKDVLVIPITHSPPSVDEAAVEIPAPVKRRLSLDADRSWVVLTEANLFAWPGPDLRPAVSGDLSSVVYGLLPRSFFRAVREGVLREFRSRNLRVVPRTE